MVFGDWISRGALRAWSDAKHRRLLFQNAAERVIFWARKKRKESASTSRFSLRFKLPKETIGRDGQGKANAASENCFAKISFQTFSSVYLAFLTASSFFVPSSCGPNGNLSAVCDINLHFGLVVIWFVVPGIGARGLRGTIKIKFK